MTRPLQKARIRVPCSTSNLGSGYDTIGLALDRYLEVSFEPGGGELVLEREGTLARLSGDEKQDLVAAAFTKVLARDGIAPHGVLRLCSTIPIARGLGSSSAAVLGGFDLARAVQGRGRADAEAFAAALKHEGHGDNAAPCLYGGLQAVAKTADGPVVFRLNLSESVGFAYAAPAAYLTTESARSVLPKSVPHKTAAAALGRLAALIRGLAEGNADLIRIGIKDDLHVPHRLPMIPSATNAMMAGLDAGAWAVTISGAGSGLIAMCEPDKAEEIARAMKDVFDAGTGDPECVGFPVKPDYEGLQRIAP